MIVDPDGVISFPYRVARMRDFRVEFYSGLAGRRVMVKLVNVAVTVKPAASDLERIDRMILSSADGRSTVEHKQE